MPSLQEVTDTIVEQLPNIGIFVAVSGSIIYAVNVLRDNKQTQKGDNMESLVALLNSLNQAISDSQAAIVSLQTQLADAKMALDAQVKMSYEQGFADGVASVPVSDKIYSQEEAEALIAAAVGPLNEQVSMLQVQLGEVQASVPVQIEAALAAFKADLLAKYEEQQVAESAGEVGFKDLLK